MIRITCFLLLSFACLFVNAQWRGDIGYQGSGNGDWQVKAGASYDFAKGRGSFGAHGFVDSTGNKGYGVSLSYKWGRRRRSAEEENKKMCGECIQIETITSGEKLQQYAAINRVNFGMIARFKRFYQNQNETILNFKIKEVLATPPKDFNISEAKVFNIYAEKMSCAMICLKDFVRDDYLITGAMFHGRLIIHDKILLFHPGLPKVDVPAADEANEGGKDDDSDDDDDDDDSENPDSDHGNDQDTEENIEDDDNVKDVKQKSSKPIVVHESFEGQP